MTFLFPAFLYAAGAVSLGVVVLHFLVTQQPRSDVLPTVRFFPDVPARSTSVAIRPSDMLLLLVRLLTIMLIGAAFAQPQLTPKHQTVATIVAVDVSRSVRSGAEVADSARKYTTGAAAVVLFDSTAHEVPAAAVKDSLAAIQGRGRGTRRGALSPAFITMLRAAARIRERADSIELVVVSPFGREEQDAATQTVRGLFPGHVRTVQVAAATDSSAAKSQKVSVQWVDAAGGAGWTKRAAADTIGAVRVGNAVMVSPFVRRWQYTGQLGQNGRVAARWMDGEIAAVEQAQGAECTRSVAFAMPTAGDVILRPDYVRLQAAINAPCGGVQNAAPMSAPALQALEGKPGLAASNAIKPQLVRLTPLMPWLLAGAFVLALLELVVRKFSGRGTANEETEEDTRAASGRVAA